MHFTSGASAMSSIEWWRNPEAKGACAHIIIDRDGTVYQTRPLNRTCGHAGVSSWCDVHGTLNPCSIGIELANAGNEVALARRQSSLPLVKAAHKHSPKNVELWEMYPPAQIAAAKLVAAALHARYHFEDIIGHDDAAPDRKNDPGPAFDMLDFRQSLGFSGLPGEILQVPSVVIPPQPAAGQKYSAALKVMISNRSVPTDEYIAQIVTTFKRLPLSVFEPNDVYDVYSSVKSVLGPWTSTEHRRAVLADVLMVLGEFESSGNWDEDYDHSNPDENSPTTKSAGAFQISANSRYFGEDLRAISPEDPDAFRAKMRSDPDFAVEYAARLLRHTVNHNGPVKRHEIDKWLRKDAVAEFQRLLA